MAEYKSVTIPLPEAQRLADFSSICTDFHRCLDMCHLIAQSMVSHSLEPVVLDALATAIPIAYARPFNGGVRDRIDSFIDVLSPDELDLHQSILHVRSKFCAHSVNGMERQQVQVWLNPEDKGGRRITNVSIAQNHILALSPAAYLKLSELCAKALDWLNAEMKAESVRLPAIILQQHTLDELYELKPSSLMQADGLDKAHLGRSRTSV